MGGNAKFAEQLETVQMTAAEKNPRWSGRSSNAVLRADLGMYKLQTNRDMVTVR